MLLGAPLAADPLPGATGTHVAHFVGTPSSSEAQSSPTTGGLYTSRT